jgi:GrpB-like predicted nucleotidyltransferase (UPF0157 family)
MSDLSEAGAGSDPVTIVPYDPRWPALFDTEAVRLSRALGETAIRIEHVGSTAVPGLAAKPVIDIQISVPVLEPATPYAGPLDALGYGNWRDVHDPDHRFCRDDPRRHHIHLVIAGSAMESDRPLFRDFLKVHSEVRRSYAEFKTGAAVAFGHDRDRYTAAKEEFIESVMSAARDWARATGWDLGT